MYIFRFALKLAECEWRKPRERVERTVKRSVKCGVALRGSQPRRQFRPYGHGSHKLSCPEARQSRSLPVTQRETVD